MEESGHYYTVYFTSLAVGFDEDIAYRHAVLAQMPDEVGWLDAANMHMAQLLPWRGTERNLSGNEVDVPNRWRYMIEFAIHSLVLKPPNTIPLNSSAFQRAITQKLLRENKPDSLKFGLLLHRIGDTYAHSVWGKETENYTVSTTGSLWPSSLGHARHGHDPDFPFLRPRLFYDYLGALHKVLCDKVVEPGSMTFKRHSKPMAVRELKQIFARIFDPGNYTKKYFDLRRPGHDMSRSAKFFMKRGFSDGEITRIFIKMLRIECKRNLGITMKDYAPESIGKQTLSQFLSEHWELCTMGITKESIIRAVEEINKKADVDISGLFQK